MAGYSLDIKKSPARSWTEKLTADDKYRRRQGNYRILYQIDDSGRRVTIVKIADRKEA